MKSLTSGGPMLAAKTPEDLDSLRYPVFASPKLDGIRCLIVDLDWFHFNVGGEPKHEYILRQQNHAIALSRTLKPIPNMEVQMALDLPSLVGLDGELIVGSPTDPDVYRTTNSGIMSHEGSPDFTFRFFDNHTLGQMPFAYRMVHFLRADVPDYCIGHPQIQTFNSQGLLEAEQSFLSDGYEGAIVRDPQSPYKYGRSTTKQGWMLKLKRFVDAEAVVTGYEELLTNANEATTDERGYTHRSTHQANKVPAGLLGALHVQQSHAGAPVFSIGTGFSACERDLLWSQRDSLIGRTVKFKSFPIGVYEKPRHPVFLGFRDETDL